MPTLMLLRHAKSDWSDPALADFDRPLNKRGRRAAPLIGRHLRKQGLIPDLVLCSSALRARQTWELVSAELKAEVPIKFLRSLYLAPPSRLLATVQRQPKKVERLMMVGHNPGMENLAAHLAGGGDAKLRARMREKFPTATLAVLGFAAEAWAGVAAGGGELQRFVVARDLE
ncbi:MAG: histidine phosphatase family protein [Kiloniellales bacterium]|nr:histidine phosphatase family protein [Kiloniellales bacterium]